MKNQFELTEIQWKTAHTMAIELIKRETDPNELGKVLSYLNAFSPRPDAGQKFFSYLTTLAKNGLTIGHSEKTVDYYINIDEVCQKYLQGYHNNITTLIYILGWVRRLMFYYKNSAPIEELNIEETKVSPLLSQSERQLEIAEAIASKTFEIGQQIEAKITNINKNKVTYQVIETTQKLTQREPKNYKKLIIEEIVKVEIIELKDDGSIKKVRYISAI